MIKTLIPFWKKYKWYCLSGIIFVILSNLAGVYAPQLTRYLLNKAIYNFEPQNKDTSMAIQYIIDWIKQLPYSSFVLVCSITILLLAVIKGVFMFLMRQTLIVMSRLVEYDQKSMLYQHCQNLDNHFYKTYPVGDIMSRIAEDISKVRMIIGPCIMYAVHIISIFCLSIYYMGKQNLELTIYILLPMPFLALIIYIVNRKVYTQTSTLQKSLSAMNSQAQESYSGIRIIHSFNQEQFRENLFMKYCNIYRLKAIKLSFTESIYIPIFSLIAGINMIILITVGGYKVIHHTMLIGTIAEFAIYIQMLIVPMSMIGYVADTMQRGLASQKRIMDFLQIQPVITSKSNAIKQNLIGNINFKNVSHLYNDTQIQALQNINITIQAGEKIAIIGKVGCGKSTIAQLLLRFEDPTKGDIFLDNINLKNLNLNNFRTQIGYVPQHSFLFADSIINNIRIANPTLTDKDVLALLSIVNMDKDLQYFNKGIHAIVGEKGTTLSGGQKQRISIARALAINPKILVLDDCFSAIDNHTEHVILKSLKCTFTNKTVILFTHRYKALPLMDRILVIDNGRIIEEGTHNDLIAKNSFYKKLYDLQAKTGRTAS